jgi:hypothetical protein
LAPGPAPAPAPSAAPAPADRPPTFQPSTPPGGGASYRPAPESEEAEDGATTLDPDLLRQPTYVKPVPDPEAPAVEPPELLNPRDRTAAARTGNALPVSWPASSQPAETRSTERPAEPVWDDSGWSSAARG